MNLRVPLVALAVWSGIGLTHSAASAQVEAEPVLRGSVRLGEAETEGPTATVAGGTVILHRVAPDTAGEIDTTRIAGDGSFSFRLPTVPDPGGVGEIYFASVEHRGILYFGEAITTAIQLDSLYVIRVYDTTAVADGGARLPVSVRYLVLEESASPEGVPADQGGAWQVTDLILVQNRGDRTLVGVDSGAVWSYPLPAAARRVQIGGGDMGPDATRVEGDRIVVRAPLPPGQRQLLLRYALEAPELDIPLPGTTEAVELLVREPAPPLRVDGLGRDRPVEMETGTTYRRYVGTNLSDATIRIAEDGAAEGGGLSPRWLAVLMAMLLGVVGLWAILRSAPREDETGPSQGGVGVGEEGREALLLEVARIDERLESASVHGEDEAQLRRRRATLVERLRGR